MSRKKNDALHQGYDSLTGEVVSGSSHHRFRSAYDHNRGRLYDSQIGGPSLTKQEFKSQCDPNVIVAHFTRTGRLEGFREAHGQYLDLTQLPGSYQESLNLVLTARSTFSSLPADVRARFGNDVSVFLAAAASNPEGVFGKRDAAGNIIAPPPLKPTTEAPSAIAEGSKSE